MPPLLTGLSDACYIFSTLNSTLNYCALTLQSINPVLLHMVSTCLCYLTNLRWDMAFLKKFFKKPCLKHVLKILHTFSICQRECMCKVVNGLKMYEGCYLIFCFFQHAKMGTFLPPLVQDHFEFLRVIYSCIKSF